MRLIKSKILDCEIVLCSRREKGQAINEYPDKVIYYYEEMKLLKGLTDDEIRAIHNVKDILGGHLLIEDEKPLTLAEMRESK